MEGARICLVGAGAAAGSLAAGLVGAGRSVTLWARRVEAAKELAERAAVDVRADLAAALADSDVVLLAVSDAALAEVAERVVSSLAPEHRPVVLHTSGYHGVEVLASLARVDCAVGVLHPLQPLVRHRAPRWSGSWFALCGDDVAVARGRELATALEAHALVLGPGEAAKHAYHAGAALLSNGTVGLFDAALACFERAGVERSVARAALAELLAANLDNLRRLDPVEALTGPASRGADIVVRGHVRALSGDADVSALYRAVTEYLVHVASSRGGLSDGGAADVRDALS